MDYDIYSLEGKEVDVTPLFIEAGIETGGSVKIVETFGMYPYKSAVKDNWAYYTAVGCKRLKQIFDQENRKIRTIGIVGICSGVEGLAVIHVFKPELQHLIVTDIDEGILDGTIVNIGYSAHPLGVEVTPLEGSFCEPIEQVGMKVDFVHANIPNLPWSGEEDLTKGAEKGTFVPSNLYEGYHPPERFVGWALGAQYAYLESAKRVLEPGGSVVTELGGRVPERLVRDLFETLDLEMSEVIVGFKEQTEALIDFIGYHRMETDHGVSFEFYRLKESWEALNAVGFQNPTWNMTGQEVKAILEPWKVSAGEALELYHQGVAVGHTVHLYRGVVR